jgi:preprotein translocase subunit SecG
MLIIFVIVAIVAALILGLIVLIQNPKGGGLSGTFGGFSNQLMGVKQTTDVLEKGTWLFAAILGILCIVSPAFIPKSSGVSPQDEKYINSPVPSTTTNSSNTVPLDGTTPAAPTK